MRVCRDLVLPEKTKKGVKKDQEIVKLNMWPESRCSVKAPPKFKLIKVILFIILYVNFEAK